MKDIATTTTAQIVKDVFPGRTPTGEEVARFLIGLAAMKAESHGAVTQQIIEEFAAVYDEQNRIIAELRDAYESVTQKPDARRSYPRRDS